MLDWFVIITFSRESIKICISFKSSCDKFSYGNLPLVSKEWTNDIVLLEAGIEDWFKSLSSKEDLLDLPLFILISI